MGNAYLEDSVTTQHGQGLVHKKPLVSPFLVTLALVGGGGAIASILVAYASTASWVVAGIIAATAILCLRIQRKVRRQIDPGDRELLQKLTEAVPGMIYQCRLYPTGRCIVSYSNSAIDWIYEQKAEDMKRDCGAIFDLVHPEDRARVWESLRDSAIHLTPWKGEYRVILPRQGLRWRFAQAQVERMADGGTLWHGFIADITWKKEAEEKLLQAAEREAEALRAAKDSAELAEKQKTEFLAMMTHEIRTPMNGVIGFTDLLKDTPLDLSQREYVQMIADSGERLLLMVNNILDVVKTRRGEMDVQKTSLDLRKTVAGAFDLLRPMAAKKELHYSLEIVEGTPERITTDSLRLGQILINLLGNAVKFTDAGCVALTVSAQPIESSQTNWEWRFAVRDTGPGIPADAIPNLFTAFYQVDSASSRKEGAGLGLAISLRMAELLGGTLQVDSKVGDGSEFILTLPSIEKNEK
ncbi:hypothetical protein BH09VER1_BH09VER1_43140 [soil metagenome]